jgi:Putative beta-barrel porin 2
MDSRGWVQASRRGKSGKVGAAIMLLTAAAASHGSQPGYQINVGVIETDNVERLPNGTSDTIFTQELGFTWHDRRPLLDADIDMDLTHLTYVPRTFGDQVVGNLIGQARLNLLPQLLFWDFTENLGEGLIDPLAALTPQNRELINYASTGPQLLVPLSGATFLDLSARYGKVTYQTSPLGSTRYSGGVGLLHNLSAATSVSFNVHDQHVDYSNTVLNTNYDSQQAYVRFEAKGTRTTLDADVGYGRLREAGDTPGMVIAHFELSRKISASSSVGASFGHEYSDAAEAFRLSQAIGGANLNTQPVLQTGNPFKSDYATVSWNFLRNRTGFGVLVSGFKDTYQQKDTLNDKRLEIDVHATRQLTPNVGVSLIEQYLRQRFENVVGSSTQTTSDARITWRTSRRVSIFLDYSFANRHGDISGTDFKENRLWLSIGYGRAAELPPGPPAPPLPHAATTAY